MKKNPQKTRTFEPNTSNSFTKKANQKRSDQNRRLVCDRKDSFC